MRALHYDLTCQIRPEIEVSIFWSEKTECTKILGYQNFQIGKTDGAVNDVFFLHFQVISNVRVAIRDVNNHAPYFMCAPYFKTVSEVRGRLCLPH